MTDEATEMSPQELAQLGACYTMSASAVQEALYAVDRALTYLPYDAPERAQLLDACMSLITIRDTAGITGDNLKTRAEEQAVRSNA